MCISEDGSRFFGCILNLYLLPLVCIVGLFLHLGCLKVFITNRRHPLVPVLIFLSICDCCQLLFSLFVLFLPALHDFSQSTPYSTLGQLSYISTGLMSPLLLSANCASIWTICYISIQRYKAIRSPFTNIYTPPKPLKPLLLIAFLAFAFNGCKWAEFQWFYSDDPTNSTNRILAHEKSALAENKKYRFILDRFLYPVLVYLIPLFLLMVLHFRMLNTISKRRLSFDHKHRMAQERRTAILLSSIVIIFFLCHTGGILYRFVDEEKYTNSELFVLFKDIINLLFNISSFINPLLYFVFTRQFRDLISSSHFTSQISRTINSPSTTNLKRNLQMPRICQSNSQNTKLLN